MSNRLLKDLLDHTLTFKHHVICDLAARWKVFRTPPAAEIAQTSGSSNKHNDKQNQSADSKSPQQEKATGNHPLIRQYIYHNFPRLETYEFLSDDAPITRKPCMPARQHVSGVNQFGKGPHQIKFRQQGTRSIASINPVPPRHSVGHFKSGVLA